MLQFLPKIYAIKLSVIKQHLKNALLRCFEMISEMVTFFVVGYKIVDKSQEFQFLMPLRPILSMPCSDNFTVVHKLK